MRRLLTDEIFVGADLQSLIISLLDGTDLSVKLNIDRKRAG